MIREINREENSTVVMVTHDRDAAARGGRVITIKDGKVAEGGA